MSIGAISRFVLGHKRLVVLFWVVVTIVGVASAGPAANALSTRFDLPGSDSSDANAAIVAQYGTGGFTQPFVAVVALPEGTTVETPGVREEIDAGFARVAEALPVVRIASYASTGDRAFVSEDGGTTFGLIYPPHTWTEGAAQVEAITAALFGATVAGAPFTLTGTSEAIVAEGSEEGGGDTGVLIETLVGGLGALVVLLWVFGSFLAIVPILIAAVSIVTTFLLVWGLTSITEVSFIVQFLIALIGLGVAIDYALLLVTRWREERSRGLDNEAAVQRAMETAGHAVVFSGTTVAIGLLALIVLPVPTLRSVGLGGMLIPLVSVVVSITLLPVLLATVGPRLDWPRFRRGDQVSHAWERWAAATVRNRWPAAALALILLGLLVIPALSMRIGEPRAETLATSGAPRDGLQALERSGIGTGVLTPFDVLVTGTDPATTAAALAEVDGVKAALAPDGPSWRVGDTAVVAVLPDDEASSSNGRDLVERLRAAAAELPGSVQIGGQPAGGADGFNAIYDNFPLMLLAITVVTYVLLVRAFRSLLLPLKAVLLNALSIGAAYGVLVLVWQEGWGSELIWGIEASGSITDWVPLMAFSFLFGLSMDYEVFILSRMREEYDATGSTDAAVVCGIGRTARLVTTAAIILFLAFVSMAAVPDTSVKIMATGLAAGILLDATIVRALLVPATVSLMGKWNWWLPSWLDWFVPNDDASSREPAPVAGSGD